jgi:hypothetical protein
MKQFGIVLGVFLVLLTLGLGNAWSQGVTLPTAIITGHVETTAGSSTTTDPGQLLLGDATGPAFISRVNYQDGSFAIANGAAENIIEAEVVLLGATRTAVGSTSFVDAIIQVRDPANSANVYLSASLINITFTQIGSFWYLNLDLNASNPASLNMENVTFPTSITSQFISELQSSLGTKNRLGMKIGMLTLSGDITGNGIFDIADGLIDGSPSQVEPPAGARTIGYWKNHDEEREAFIGEAAITCFAVYGPDPGDPNDPGDLASAINSLRHDLTLKGKKDMIQKARQQLAALCLNVNVSLDPMTELDADECDILSMITGATCTGPTVGDAVTAIINAINDANPDNDEDAKDLADEINNRDNS